MESLRVLLVEDNRADAHRVREFLEGSAPGAYQIDQIASVCDAAAKLQQDHVDVLLLDLRVQHPAGEESAACVRDLAADVPIVVLAGTSDEGLALSCLDAGAQDFLCKSKITANSLGRAIRYAVARFRTARRMGVWS